MVSRIHKLELVWSSYGLYEVTASILIKCIFVLRFYNAKDSSMHHYVGFLQAGSHITIENGIVIGTRKHTEVIIMHNLFLCHRKLTVAAAYNLSVHVLQRIVIHKKYMETKFFSGHNSFI